MTPKQALAIPLSIIGTLLALTVFIAPFAGLGVWLFAGWSGWWVLGGLCYDMVAGPIALGCLKGSQELLRGY